MFLTAHLKLMAFLHLALDVSYLYTRVRLRRICIYRGINRWCYPLRNQTARETTTCRVQSVVETGSC